MILSIGYSHYIPLISKAYPQMAPGRGRRHVKGAAGEALRGAFERAARAARGAAAAAGDEGGQGLEFQPGGGAISGSTPKSSIYRWDLSI